MKKKSKILILKKEQLIKNKIWRQKFFMNDNLKIERINEQIKQIDEAIANPRLAEGTSSTYSRISGYYRSVSNWNTGKKAEFEARKNYQMT
jgi:hypothetical protein